MYVFIVQAPSSRIYIPNTLDHHCETWPPDLYVFHEVHKNENFLDPSLPFDLPSSST